MNREVWLDDSHISILEKWCIRVIYFVYHSINQSMKYDSIFIVHDRSSKRVSIMIWKEFFRVQLNKIQIVIVQSHLLISIIDGDNLSKYLLYGLSSRWKSGEISFWTSLLIYRNVLLVVILDLIGIVPRQRLLISSPERSH